MSKNFITVSAHKRAFPKRKFAEGGASSDRPDLDILAKQGLSPEKAPGTPPRMKEEEIFSQGLRNPRSYADTGSGKPVPVERASDDAVHWFTGQGSTIGEMMNTSADRVQKAHDDARAAAAMKAFHESQKPVKRAVGGRMPGYMPGSDLGWETPLPEQEREDRMRQYGFDPMPSYTRGVNSAEDAAPLPMPSRVPSSAPMSPSSAPPMPAGPTVQARGSASREAAPVAAPADTAQAPYVKPIPTGGGSRASESNSPDAPKSIDWKGIAESALKAQQAAGPAGQSPYGGLAALAGGALGKYLKNRKPAGSPDAMTSADQGEVDSPAGLMRRRGTSGDTPYPQDASDIAGDVGGFGSDALEGVDLSSLAPDFGPDMVGDFGDFFAKGGEVGPSGANQQRRARPMRPGTPTSAPAGGAVGSLTGAPAGGPNVPAWMNAPPPAPGGSMANQAMAPSPAAMQAMRSAQMGQMGQMGPGAPSMPGGPPQGGAIGPMMPPGGPPPGPPPGMGSVSMGGPGAAQYGPPAGAMPPGPPPGAMPPGPPPGGPPPMGRPPGMPGGPPPGPPPGGGAMGPLPPGAMPPGPPPGGPPPGGGGPPMQMATAPGIQGMSTGMARLMGVDPATGMADPNARAQEFARQQAMIPPPPPGMAKGGAVQDTEGDSPRVKATRERVWGDVGKPAEDLPPVVEKKAKGGSVKRRAPFGKDKKSKPEKKMPVPMVTDEDMGTAPSPIAAAAAPPPPAPAPPPAAPPPGMNKGGKCEDKMAAGGVAKLRRGFPNTNKKPAKRMAKGGSVRGCGVATKGKGFSGIY